jgi:hypothetical protein
MVIEDIMMMNITRARNIPTNISRKEKPFI